MEIEPKIEYCVPLAKFDGNTIKNIRNKMALTQPEFSVKFGVPVATLRAWEQGARSPSSAAKMMFINLEQRPHY